ncbi:hypothetical protein IFM89_015281 [Coptis chinensis]|uniref:Ubiquitin thioesterase OTU n=1 Tax=Coptis chinensis TaxID=261450 RepID=A0A835HDH2_9MAGN|nr:hypothetical protein IFM89_015281 [Coptis chinensis]
MAEPEADKNKNDDSGGGEEATENNKKSPDPESDSDAESDSSSEGGGFIDYFPRGVEDTNTPEYNIKLFDEVLNSKEMQKKREKEEKEFQFHEDLFDFPKDPEKWTEQDLQELWADAPLDMKKPGWDPVWADADDWDVVLDELEEGRDPPIAPFYLPYRKHYPAIPDNHFDISTPESVIEELDRIEEFLRWVSYIFPDGSSYEGTVWDDLAHGKGVYVAEEGLVRYEGEWLQNNMEGHGVVEVDIPDVEPVPGSKLEEKMRAEGRIIKRDYMSPEDREWLEMDIEDSYRLADGWREIPFYENDEWVRQFGSKPEKGRYRYAGQWKHGRMHGCGVYEVNERPIFGRFYFGELVEEDTTLCDDNTSMLHAGIAEVAAAKARMFVNKPDGSMSLVHNDSLVGVRNDDVILRRCPVASRGSGNKKITISSWKSLRGYLSCAVVREQRGPYSDPQHPYMYEAEDVWMAPGFINQFYEVPDYWKTYVHEVDEEREMWLNSFYKAPLRIPMPAELEYWWSKDDRPEFVILNKEPEPDPEDPSKLVYTEDPLILHTKTGRLINFIEDEKYGVRLFWQPPLNEGEEVDPEKAEFLPLGFDEFYGRTGESEKKGGILYQLISAMANVCNPVFDKLEKWSEEKRKADQDSTNDKGNRSKKSPFATTSLTFASRGSIQVTRIFPLVEEWETYYNTRSSVMSAGIHRHVRTIKISQFPPSTFKTHEFESSGPETVILSQDKCQGFTVFQVHINSNNKNKLILSQNSKLKTNLSFGIVCPARAKPWILTALTFTHGATFYRLSTNHSSFTTTLTYQKRNHLSTCCIGNKCGAAGGAASIWHAIFPSTIRNELRGSHHSLVAAPFHHEQKGEGSWNVAWDVRPARWLHSSDSAWLLFGVCACLAPTLDYCFVDNLDESLVDEYSLGKEECSVKYRVIGVPGDGRCLFRAVSYGACMKCGEEAPDENRQIELADDLRARVADELLKRREETEWIIEGDFDIYVKRIQQPYAWGGEPELLMASHVLRMPISVYMIDRRSGDLVNIASYGHEYGQDESPIQVVFHGYGHYDVLDIVSDGTYQIKEL